jgi:hypothetical protein
MASIASIISIIVLLAAYGYSIPVENKFETSTYPTSRFEFTTGKTIVDNKDRITAHLMNSAESASVPTVVVPREFMERLGFSTPATTAESHELGPRESQMFGDKLATSSPFTLTTEFPSSNLFPRVFGEKKFVDETTTFRPSNSAEEKLSFPKRSFGSNEHVMDKSNSAEVFATTSFPKRSFDSNEHVMDKSNSAEVFATTSFPKRSLDKSNSAEVFLTTPVMNGESKEVTSAERVNLRPLETSTKKLSGRKQPVKTTSVEVDRSTEEPTIQRPIKVTPRVPIREQERLRQ